MGSPQRAHSETAATGGGGGARLTDSRLVGVLWVDPPPRPKGVGGNDHWLSLLMRRSMRGGACKPRLGGRGTSCWAAKKSANTPSLRAVEFVALLELAATEDLAVSASLSISLPLTSLAMLGAVLSVHPVLGAAVRFEAAPTLALLLALVRRPERRVRPNASRA